MVRVLATGSKGNAVIYHETILVDCGVPFSLIRPNLYLIRIVLLSHEHGDHFNIQTLKRLAFERPSMRFGCCEWLKEKMYWCKNLDVYEIGKVYDYGAFKISPVRLYHDVSNCGYRIFKGETKILHATDTAHLEGIEAKNYDLYALEHNYDEETIEGLIKDKRQNGQFVHEIGAINSHLSEQQARDFYFKNKGENSKIIILHD